MSSGCTQAEAPAFSGFCHCDTCKQSRRLPVHHGVVWPMEAFKITTGDESTLTAWPMPAKKLSVCVSIECDAAQL